MRKTIVLFTIVAIVAGLMPLLASAQAEQKGPPKVLQIDREFVKPGKASAHEKYEAGWSATFAKANWPTYYLAADALTGTPEAWFIVGFDSVEAMEKNNQATEKNASLTASIGQLSAGDAEYVSGTKRMVAVYRENLSYQAAAVKVPAMRYFNVVTIHVRPGHDEEFRQARLLSKEAHEKASADEHFAVFQVISGAPGGTYLIFLPMKSLAEIDNWDTLHNKVNESMGADGLKRYNELTSNSVESAEFTYFQFNPKMSYESKEWIAADPAFWAPKATVAKAAPAKTPVTKAAKKEKE